MNCFSGCIFVRRIHRIGLGAVFALLALAVSSGSLFANYYRLWQGQAHAQGSGIGSPPPGYGDTENYNNTVLSQFTVPFSHTLTAGHVSADGSGDAYLSGVVQAGVMDAFGTADASSSINERNPGTYINSWGYANLTLKWLDDISVDSLQKPEDDGYVHLPWNLKLTDAISLGAPPDVDPFHYSAASSNVSASLVATSIDLSNTLASVSLFDSANLQRSEQISSGVVILKPGTMIEVYSTLSIKVDAEAYWEPGTVSAQVAATHSLDFYLDPDPVTGAMYTTASGSTYFSPPVPEPASVVLASIGFGLAEVYCLRPRQQRWVRINGTR